MKNPFSRGNPCLNCFAALCGPLPPSFLNLRSVATPDNHNFMHMNIVSSRAFNPDNADDILHYQIDEPARMNNYVRELFFFPNNRISLGLF